jgi:hypothetical protein
MFSNAEIMPACCRVKPLATIRVGSPVVSRLTTTWGKP